MTHGDCFIYAHEHREEIIWMSQNTNQLPTDPRIEGAMLDAIRQKDYVFYPYNKGVFGLREALLADVNAPEEYEALITNGAIEALYALTRALLKPGDGVICTNPSFMPIHHQIRLCGAVPVELPIYAPPYKMTVEQAQEAIDARTKALLLIDPHNPMGSQYDKDEVKGLCDLAEDYRLWFIHDITYIDFAHTHTAAHDIIPERTIDVYSFSKNSAMAGMRIGGLMAPGAIMELVEPYNTNVLSANVIAQRAALASLETKKEWIGRMVGQARRNQAMIKEAVDDIPGLSLPVYPSGSNMFVMDLGDTGIDPDRLQEELLYEHNIFVRSGTYVSEEFGDRFVRISFTVPEEGIKMFVAALPEAVRKLSSSP
ncbi:MAG: pyridoxal phosphate-dependent aminotransferase [Thermoplasmata archaeon]|nr:pyridoxal phosphate-dependent aminotransferase [Thermoplasmata archaeon]